MTYGLPSTDRALSRRRFLSSLAAAPLALHGAQHAGSGNRARYTRREFPAPGMPAIEGVRHEVWTAHPPQGPGPDVIVLHEITGASDLFFAYTDTLVDAGFSVHCPVLFGSAFIRSWWLRDGISALQACNDWSEFKCTQQSAYTPLNRWLVALSGDISGSSRRRLGAIGMCLTGIQPLAMLRCRSVVAPVLCQPTLPLGRDDAHALDLGLPPSDADFALARVLHEPLDVLMIRYAQDRISSEARARRLNEMFRPRMTFVELPGNDHSSLVHDPDPGGIARKSVIDFLRSHLT